MEPGILEGHGIVVRDFDKVASCEKLLFMPPGPDEVRVKVEACGLCQVPFLAAIHNL